MQWFAAVFVLAVVLETAIRLWLATRQIATVRAHRGRVPEVFRSQISLSDHQKAADYTVARAALGRWSMAVEAAVKLTFTVGGGLAAIDASVSSITANEPWHGCLLVAAVMVLLQVVGLPFAVLRTFGIEARFGFNRASPAMFVVDRVKQAAVGVALGAPLLLATLVLMQKAGAWWWVWAWCVWLGVTLLLTWAAPRFIAPLFNRFTPMADPTLEKRVGALLERCGFAARGGLFVMDGSRRSAHGNAYFTGIGRHRRIVFFDTLLARIEPEEVEAVLAHELGHFRLHHIRQRLLTSMLGMLAGLALLGVLAAWPQFYEAFHAAPGAAMALLLFAMIVPVGSFFLTPLESWWSRRQERQADDFAVTHADAAHLVTALVKLYRDNASTLTPDPLHSVFYDSHPPAVVRIARLNAIVAGA